MKGVLLFILAFTSVSHAASVVFERKVQTYLNDSVKCQSNDSCGLKEFSLIVERKKTMIARATSPSFTTDVRYIVKTKNKNEIESFGIVQYIRGCQYSTEKSSQGILKRMDISRHYMTGMTLFQHVDWSIDSDSDDPVYTSYKSKRHALYRWNKNPASYNPETATFYKPEALPVPVVFATDLPGSFSIQGNVAKNSSLEFEVCLFRMNDLPLVSTPDGAGIQKSDAIKCFLWESKYTYDFVKRDYKVGGALDPFCLEKR